MSKKTKSKDPYVHTNRESIGGSIRRFREKKGYSQDELAEKMEVHRSTISKVETGKFAISIDYLVKFGLHLDFQITLLEKK